MRTLAQITTALCMALTAAAANAAAIGVQFTDNGVTAGTSPTNNYLTPSQMAGVVPQANWNVDFGAYSGSNLKDSTGASTTMSYSAVGVRYGTVGANFPAADPNQAGDNVLFRGEVLSAFGNPATLALSGIPYAKYDVYLYLGTDYAGRTGTISDGTTTIPFTAAGPGSAFIQIPAQDGNYALFSGETASALTLTLMVPQNDGFNAVQIVDAASAIPEPASLGLLGGGLVLLLKRGRGGCR